MASITERPLPTPGVDRRWLWAVRMATVLCLLLISAPAVLMEKPWLPVLPMLAAYLTTLWLLRGKRQKKGLALAVGTGSVMSAPLLLSVVVALMLRQAIAHDWGLTTFIVGLALAHVALVATAIKTYYTMEREPGDRKTLVKGFVVGTLCFATLIAIAFAIWVQQEERRQANERYERHALTWVYKIMAVARYYASTFDNGYPLNLKVLEKGLLIRERTRIKEDCNAPFWVDPSLTSVRLEGYIFKLTLGPPVAAPPKGCTPGAQSYTLVASPIEYGKTGRRSLFVDESGVVHQTTEDRPATADDPPIE